MEAFPVVILEALSCETPVMATPVGGVPEVIRDGENGILVPVNNPPKLAEAIRMDRNKYAKWVSQEHVKTAT